ncbi:hypothetical protein A9Z42_0020910 [Trichoderma parareesei]|uniref:Uncharacterized protein n=1 Tax=Trichoderma parareesei TaxID=858221 RepID=A0A2H2ZED3_TRIPA|nr:hypothetical protein A9Z42_0020910 [Trichoderma parareesei]
MSVSREERPWTQQQAQGPCPLQSMDNVAGQSGAARLQGIGMRTWRRTVASDSGDFRRAGGSWIWQTTVRMMILWEMDSRLGHGAMLAWQKDPGAMSSC